MDELKKQVDELKAQLKQVAEDVSKEFTQQKIKQYQTSARLESLIRLAVEKQGVSFDDYIDFVESYIKFSGQMEEIMKSETLVDRIKKATDFNETALVKVYADDISVLPVIAQTGGISKALKMALYNLPHTKHFSTELEKIINEEDASVVAN